MLNKEELEELVFYADKVANVHGSEHPEYIRLNEIVKGIVDKELLENDFFELRELTNNYIIPEGACKAQNKLLNLVSKINKK